MRPLKILFSMRSSLYLRNFESTIRLLASRGHALIILISPDEYKTLPEAEDLRLNLMTSFPETITFGKACGRTDRFEPYLNEIRATRDYLRFRTPYFAGAPKLASRVRTWASPLAQHMLDKEIFTRESFNRRVNAWLAGLEAAVPPDPSIVAQLEEAAPDVVLATPLVDLGADQVDWIKAARALGIASALPVASWDNLTNKGVIQVIPDRVIVWNNMQKQEAIDLHGVPAEAVEVTGAQLFDQWFERRPSRGYETFCAELGLDPNEKTILYVGSTRFIARDETQFVRRWINAVRHDRGPALRSANILVRPHPMHQEPFQNLDLAEFGRCAIHPRRGGLPVSEPARADYFDALHHCSALVGINTSALVEASILGKRCFSVRDPEFALTQEGTVHFHYLVNGGLLSIADGFPEHLDQLEAEISAAGTHAAGIQAFVKEFIRPLGLDVAGTPRLADVIEATAGLATSRSPAARRTIGHVAAGPLVRCSSWSRRQAASMKKFKRRMSRFLELDVDLDIDAAAIARRGGRRTRALVRGPLRRVTRVASRVTRVVTRVTRVGDKVSRKAAQSSSRVFKRAGRRMMRYRPSELHRKFTTLRGPAAVETPQLSVGAADVEPVAEPRPAREACAAGIDRASAQERSVTLPS